MTSYDPSRLMTTDEFDQQLLRLINHYHPGRNPQDFTTWGTEIRRFFGSEPADVVVRAITLWKMKEAKLPIISSFKDFVAEARRQLQVESERLLPAPDFKGTSKKPSNETLEWHLCKGVAQFRIWAAGGSASPDEEQIQAVWAERRRKGMPVGDIRFNPAHVTAYRQGGWRSVAESSLQQSPITGRAVSAHFAGWGEILERRRRKGILTPEQEDYLRERMADDPQGEGPVDAPAS